MKKRFIKVLLSAVLIVLVLGGCKGFGEYSRPNDQRLVSVIGFDNNNGRIRAVVEALEATENGGMAPFLISEEGDTAIEALTKVAAQSPRELSFAHCSAIILGEELSPKQIDMILEHCSEDNSISLSVKVISAEKAENMLSMKAESAVSSGFAMADIAEKTAERFGYGGHASLYEINTARMQTANVYALPYFEKRGEQPYLSGMLVYINDKTLTILSSEESVAYAVMRNTYEGGQLYHQGSVYTIDSATSKIKARFENGRLSLKISLLANPHNAILSESIENMLSSFDEDIFGTANTIEASYPEIWRAIKEDYGAYYKNAKIVIGEE